MAHSILTLSVIAVLVISVGVSAKRGCASFGHSCLGGHGKRSDASLDPSLELARRLRPAEAAPLSPGDDIIPVRDGGALERSGDYTRDAMEMKLRNVLRWMDYYRRARQSNGDGYLFENI